MEVLVYIILTQIHVFAGIDAGFAFAVLTKCLPIAFLIAAVWASGRKNVVMALSFSLLGDFVSEMTLPGDTARILQVFFFALAQICYIREFTGFRRMKDNVTMSILPWCFGIYAVLIIGMVTSACTQKREHKPLFVIGAILFFISDSLILVRILSGGFPFDSELVMETYYAAQLLLNYAILGFKNKSIPKNSLK